MLNFVHSWNKAYFRAYDIPFIFGEFDNFSWLGFVSG